MANTKQNYELARCGQWVAGGYILTLDNHMHIVAIAWANIKRPQAPKTMHEGRVVYAVDNAIIAAMKASKGV